MHNLFCIGLIPCDADRQPIRTATMRGDKVLGRRRFSEAERLDKSTVAISRWCHVHVLRALITGAGQ